MSGVAWAADAAAPAGMANIAQFVPLILIFVVFYFLLIRPQQKKAKEHKALVEALAARNEQHPLTADQHRGERHCVPGHPARAAAMSSRTRPAPILTETGLE